MIAISVVAYIAIVAWFVFGDAKSQRNSTTVGACLSSFFAVYYWDENNFAMAIYIFWGLVCVFFHWISDNTQTNNSKRIRKSKILAAFLAFFLGMFGVHKFYLRKSTLGLLYVLFFWTGIPWAIGLIESVCLLVIKKEKFDELYNGGHAAAFPKLSLSFGKKSRKSNNHTDFNEVPVHEGINERDGDNLNYQNIRVGGYKAEAIGVIEDFSIIIKTNGNTYKFAAKNGDICSCRSSSMRGTKHYEVTNY